MKALRILEGILRQPTAPFHEHRVRAELIRILDRAGIPWRLDPAGNLVARYRRGKARPVTFLAHMDHPGFEILSVDGHGAIGVWNGQMPTFALKGLRLALWSDGPEGRRGTARALEGDGRTPGDKRFRLSVPKGTRVGDFGYADLVPFRLGGGRITSKALDNVGGCAAIVACLEHLSRRRLTGDVLAVFTRAEEVGFHGAHAALRSGTLPRRRPAVVLECSRAMPGAEQGKGPVIRVGDRMTVFDPAVAAACEEAARAQQARRPDFRFQRRLMDGGACEATVLGLSGIPCICLAFPLGGYHNIGEKGVVPEFIDTGDFLGGVEALVAFAVIGLDPAGARKRQRKRALGAFGAEQELRLRASRTSRTSPSARALPSRRP